MKHAAFITMLALLCFPVAAQPRDPADLSRLEKRLPNVAERLRDLKPTRPREYFELAEEIAQQAQSTKDDELATRLFVLTFELARTRGADQSKALMASSALALADLARSETERRWLGAIARSLDPRYGLPDWATGASRTESGPAGYEAALVIGHLRAGEGSRARRFLKRESVRTVIDRYAAVLGGSGDTEILTKLDSEAKLWPCPRCSNKRAITRREGDEAVTVPCPTCKTDPGWRLTSSMFINSLKFESIVLNNDQRTWAAQLTIDSGAPLLDPDPSQLALQFGVNANTPYFRDGRWTGRP